MFSKLDLQEDYKKNMNISQEVEAKSGKQSWQHFDNSAHDPGRNSHWNGLSPLNRENQMHYQKVLNRSKPCIESDESSESETERESLQRRKRKKNTNMAHNPPKRLRRHSQIGDIATPKQLNGQPRQSEAQEQEYSARTTLPFQDGRSNGRNAQRYGVMNISSGHYSHAEFTLPPSAPESMPRRSRTSSWIGPDIPDGEKWGSAESGGFGQRFPPGTPYEHHKSSQRQLRNQIHQSASRVTGKHINKIGHLQAPMREAFQKPLRYQSNMMASDIHTIYRLPETIDLTTPDSRQSQRNTNRNSLVPEFSRNEPLPKTETTDSDEWDSEIQDYKSAQIQSYFPTGSVQSGYSSNNRPRYRAEKVLPNNGNGYPSQYTEHYNGKNYYGSSSTPIISSEKRQNTSLLAPDGCEVPTQSYFYPEIDSNVPYSQNQTRENLIDPIFKTSTQCEDHKSAARVAMENNSDSDGNKTMEELFRKNRTKKCRAVVKNMPIFPLKRVVLKPNDGEESSVETLVNIRGVDTAVANKLSNSRRSSIMINGGERSRMFDTKQTAVNKIKALEKERADQRRQKAASEIIARRQKEAEKMNDFNTLFEESTVDETNLFRIQKEKEIEKVKKQIREDARIVEEGSIATQEKLEAARKMRAAQESEEKRAQKQQRIEEKRQSDNKKEEERLNAKRKIAFEAVRLQRVADEEAQIAAIRRLEADRVAAKKRAVALQAFKKADRKLVIAEDGDQHDDTKPSEASGSMSDDGMFVPDDSGPFPPTEPEEKTGIDSQNEEIYPLVITQQDENIAVEANAPSGQDEATPCDKDLVSAMKSVDITTPMEVDVNITDEWSIAQKSMNDTVAALDEIEESSVTQLNIPKHVITPKPVITTDGLGESPAMQLNIPNLITSIEEVGGSHSVQLSTSNSASLIHGFDESSSVQPSVPELSTSSPDRIDQSSDLATTTSEKQTIATVSDDNRQNATVINVIEPPAPSRYFTTLSISAVASDGRRRPPEFSKPKPIRARSPDPIRFTSLGRTTIPKSRKSEPLSDLSRPLARKKTLGRVAEKSTSQTEAKLQKALDEVENLNVKARAKQAEQQKEWDHRLKQLSAMLLPQDPRDINGKAESKTSDASKNGRPASATSHRKPPSVMSQINFVSTIESQLRERKKVEETKLAKFEKDKATRRKRYDREIRTILSGQGLDQDDERIAKQVDEKIATWEENRQKRARRESGDKDLPQPISQDDSMLQSDAEHDSGHSQPTTSTEEEKAQDLQTQKENERAQAVRAGVNFLASQNRIASDFSKAASKFRVEEFESDESEEDPDDEPDVPAVRSVLVDDSTLEELEKTNGVEVDKTLNPAALDESIIPPLPKVPQQPETSTAFLPDIVNPKEEDMIHSYSVRHRASRENNVFDSVVLGSFHCREEANEYARHKLTEFNLGPSTGRSETHDDDNLYVGEVTTNKDKDHTETVWVTREIVYIGDTANVKHNDLKPIVPAKVYSVLQITQSEEENNMPIGTIIATVTIKSLANKKAADHFLLMTKPSRPRMDSMAFYNDTVIPSVHKSLVDAEEEDVTVDFEGVIPDTGKAFSISISENLVAGPLN